MAYPNPPHIDAAQRQLLAAIEQVDKKKIDALATSWAEVEKSVIKLLGGAFELSRPDHQAIALGLAGLLGERLRKEVEAFWFPNRETAEGAVLGFADALIMLSPFGAVVDALRQANLLKLDDTLRDIRQTVAKAKFSLGGAGQQKLSPLDYQRLFDPAFVQFVSIDPAKANEVFQGTPEKVTRDVRDALSRAGAKLPNEAKQQLEGQIVTALQRLAPGKPIPEQVERAPRLLELLVHLFGTVKATSGALEELWQDVVFPLLYIGAPATFPPIEGEELEAARQGLDPLFLFLDMVPFQTSAPEEGLMGAFATEELALPHPSFERTGSLRLVKLKTDRIKGLLAAFDPARTKDAVTRFSAQVAEQIGKKPEGGGEGAQLLETALTLLSELKTVVEGAGELHLRRVTEAEASSEGALAVVREALQGPRLILV